MSTILNFVFLTVKTKGLSLTSWRNFAKNTITLSLSDLIIRNCFSDLKVTLFYKQFVEGLELSVLRQYLFSNDHKLPSHVLPTKHSKPSNLVKHSPTATLCNNCERSFQSTFSLVFLVVIVEI